VTKTDKETVTGTYLVILQQTCKGFLCWYIWNN